MTGFVLIHTVDQMYQTWCWIIANLFVVMCVYGPIKRMHIIMSSPTSSASDYSLFSVRWNEAFADICWFDSDEGSQWCLCYAEQT